jgi:hypothetical protein
MILCVGWLLYRSLWGIWFVALLNRDQEGLVRQHRVVS